jgi:hypothetical protein
MIMQNCFAVYLQLSVEVLEELVQQDYNGNKVLLMQSHTRARQFTAALIHTRNIALINSHFNARSTAI